ncbi:MAG: NADH-quinone oxidoreductase subunit N [Nitrospinota bacterium]
MWPSIPDVSLQPILPILWLCAGAIAVLLVDAFHRGTLGGLTGLSLFFLAGAAASAVWGWDAPQRAFSGMFVSDRLTHAFTFIFLLGTGLTILLSHGYAAREGIANGEYYALVLFAAAGMIMMAGGSNLITIFLGLEVMSLAVYVLAGFFKTRPASSEASLKYFLMGAFSTGFLLYGIALIYGSTGTFDHVALAETLARRAREGTTDWLLLSGMGLLVVGFGFKVAAVPFHMWAPDVYEGAPTSVTGFMAAAVKAAGFSAFLRVFAGPLAALHVDWSGIVWVVAVLTMTIGNVAAITQRNLKRMLAYSSIAHAGYLLVALVALNPAGAGGLLFYLLQYTLSTVGAFGVIIALGGLSGQGREPLELSDYDGLGYRHPAMGFALALFMFSLAGLPPTAGFVGKFYVFSAAVQAGYTWLVILAVLNSVAAVYYYLEVVVHLYMREPQEIRGVREAVAGSLGAASGPLNPQAVVLRVGVLVAAGLLIAAWGTLHLGIFPSQALALANLAVTGGF